MGYWEGNYSELKYLFVYPLAISTLGMVLLTANGIIQSFGAFALAGIIILLFAPVLVAIQLHRSLRVIREDKVKVDYSRFLIRFNRLRIVRWVGIPAVILFTVTIYLLPAQLGANFGFSIYPFLTYVFELSIFYVVGLTVILSSVVLYSGPNPVIVSRIYLSREIEFAQTGSKSKIDDAIDEFNRYLSAALGLILLRKTSFEIHFLDVPDLRQRVAANLLSALEQEDSQEFLRWISIALGKPISDILERASWRSRLEPYAPYLGGAVTLGAYIAQLLSKSGHS